MRLLIADDHALIRKGIKLILLEEFPSAVIEEASDAETVINKMVEANCDMIISDMSMPGRSGLDVVHYAQQNFPHIPVLVLSIHPEEQYAMRVLKAGAAGYLCKDAASDELVKAVQKILSGRKYISSGVAEKLTAALMQGFPDEARHEILSDREFEVFKLLASGKSVSEIAEQMCLSAATVSTYRTRIMIKMDMRTNADIVRYAIEHKL